MIRRFRNCLSCEHGRSDARRGGVTATATATATATEHVVAPNGSSRAREQPFGATKCCGERDLPSERDVPRECDTRAGRHSYEVSSSDSLSIRRVEPTRAAMSTVALPR